MAWGCDGWEGEPDARGQQQEQKGIEEHHQPGNARWVEPKGGRAQHDEEGSTQDHGHPRPPLSDHRGQAHQEDEAADQPGHHPKPRQRGRFRKQGGDEEASKQERQGIEGGGGGGKEPQLIGLAHQNVIGHGPKDGEVSQGKDTKSQDAARDNLHKGGPVVSEAQHEACPQSRSHKDRRAREKQEDRRREGEAREASGRGSIAKTQSQPGEERGGEGVDAIGLGLVGVTDQRRGERRQRDGDDGGERAGESMADERHQWKEEQATNHGQGPERGLVHSEKDDGQFLEEQEEDWRVLMEVEGEKECPERAGGEVHRQHGLVEPQRPVELKLPKAEDRADHDERDDRARSRRRPEAAPRPLVLGGHRHRSYAG